MTSDANDDDCCAETYPVRAESMRKQVIERGGILAIGRSHSWYSSLFFISCLALARIISSDADSFLLSDQEVKENLDLSLISTLETDDIFCLSDDRVPDYFITL